MSQASLLEDRSFHVNILQTDTHHNIPSQSQWSPLGRKLILKEGCVCVSKCILDLSVICIAFIRRNFHALLTQIKINNIKKKPTIYLKMALGSHTSRPVLPRLRSLRFSILEVWSPGIRGGNWARVCGQGKLEALRPGWYMCLPMRVWLAFELC